MTQTVEKLTLDSDAPVADASVERSAPVLRVEGISKIYDYYEKPSDRLLDALLRRRRSRPGDLYALRDVSFDVHRGEAFAVIGANGAGKSTLLQIIVGTTFPTAGRVERPARVANLLEIGAGFNQTYTGRENIEINAILHGMSRKEIAERTDGIIAFADIGEFIDRPVNTYSMGMYLRLAFAIAVSMEPDLMVIDEALAVGDVFFQQKCFTRLRELKAGGTAILLVTHSMGDAQQFCDRALVLKRGEAFFIGPADEAVQHYLTSEQAPASMMEPPVPRPSRTVAATSKALTVDPPATDHADGLDRWPDEKAFVDLRGAAQISANAARCMALAITDRGNHPSLVFRQGDWARFFFEFEVFKDVVGPYAGVMLSNREGILVHAKGGLQLPIHLPPLSLQRSQRVRFHHEIKLGLQVGEYTVSLGFGCAPPHLLERWSEIPYNEGDALAERLCIVNLSLVVQVVGRQHGSPSALSHHGIADLPVRQIVDMVGHTEQASL